MLMIWAKRSIDYETGVINGWYEERRALMMKQMFPEGHAEMTFVGCSVCGQKANYLCGGGKCETTVYCSKLCQSKDWSKHQYTCK